MARGCNGERRWVVGSTYVFGCPNKLLTPEIMQAIDAWARWKRFGWPYAGGWAEQPARYVDAIEAIEIESAAADARRVEKAKSGNGN